MNQMHNLGKAADRKSVGKIFGRSYVPPNTSHVKNTEGLAHACQKQQPGDLATLSSHSIHPTRSVNIPSSPGAGDTSQCQETASMKDTCLTLLPHLTPPHHCPVKHCRPSSSIIIRLSGCEYTLDVNSGSLDTMCCH